MSAAVSLSLTEAEGMFLYDIITDNLSVPFDTRLAFELEDRGLIEWGKIHGSTAPFATGYGHEALAAWLDPSTRADLIASGELEVDDQEES